jgi:putative tryptophan/tyrosine transport system substrate-binding protein
MNRRAILTGAVASGLAPIGGSSHAQTAGKVYRIGVLVNRSSPGVDTDTLRFGLKQLGYAEGTDIVFDIRPAEGQLDRHPGFAAELVSSGVDLIVTYGGPATIAARNATESIPVVFALVADPVSIRAAATLNRPGGNLTGVTNSDPELPARQMSLLKMLFPSLARVAIFSDASIPGADGSGLAPIDRANVDAARAVGVTPQVIKLRGPKPDFEAAFNAMASKGAEALVALEVPSVFALTKTVAELATVRRIPTMLWGGQGDAGALMCYGTSYVETFPRVALYVDRIIKGGKPADMAIEVVAKHKLVIDRTTASALGVSIPAELSKLADRIID